jgi:RHS repeat-associated protein
VQNATANYGLVLLQQSASGSVYASFCSELGWSPCAAGQAPKLTITYTMPTSLAAYEAEAQPLAPAAVVVTKYYYLGNTRVAMRKDGALYYLFGDHLGSTSVSTNNTGATTNDVRYFAYGGQRSGNVLNLPTDHTFTGQRRDGDTGLLFYNARWYDPAVGRFLQADTIVPEPGDPQSLNRYAYTRNNPLSRVDPSGHADIPPIPELMQQAIKFFTEAEWQVVGEPSKISPNWNGADLAFTRTGRVLAVELKDIAGKVDLGTLGKSARFPDYGGSIDRVGRSAARLAESSVEPLRLMSQTVRDAKNAGTLENALFTSAEGVSQKA